MPPIAVGLAEVLSGVRRPGDFYMSGTCAFLAPSLEVQGVGPIALPLLPVQAEQLVAVAERAPYGRGADTLVDTGIRRTWQIDPDRVRIRGRAWGQTLDTIVARAAEGLGLVGPVAAALYKLLVYDEGAFFVSHRDSEKTPGMFGTLVVVLPAVYTGGELVIRHAEREVRLDLCCTEPSDVAFAAFYADCTHEVLPVLSGCRLTLVYNLSRAAPGKPPRPPSYAPEQDRLSALLRQWGNDKRRANDGGPEKLIYPLTHRYTAAGLSFDALKGEDAAKAATLLAAARDAGCDLHLALVSIEESGAAEYTGNAGGYGHYDEDAFEALEVDDRSETLSDWRRPEGGEAGLGTLPIVEGEASPPDAFADLVPDEESFQEATGNAGASFERSYRVAALVVWPSHRRLAVINQGGLSATLPYLADLAGRWAQGCADPASPLWAEAHDLSGHIVAAWPRPAWQHDTPPSPTATMLTLLCALGDTVRIDGFLTDAVAAGGLTAGDGEPAMRALALLPPSRAATVLERLVAGNAAVALAACCDMLARAAAAAFGAFDLRPAAAALLASLPGNPARLHPEATPWERPRPIGHDTVVNVMCAFARIDPVLADKAADLFSAWPKTYGPDDVLVPAGLALGASAAAGAPAVEKLNNVCKAHLRARIAEHLAPPADWARDASLTCRCRFCSELAAFLADPDRKTWSFKSLQANRSHVEGMIRQCRCDVETETLRRGSPHSLVCTKNQASYQRRLVQRRKDLENLARFEQP